MAFTNNIQSSGGTFIKALGRCINGTNGKIDQSRWTQIQSGDFEVIVTNPNGSTTTFAGAGFYQTPQCDGNSFFANALSITNRSDCEDFVIRVICKANLKADGADAVAKASYFLLPRGASVSFASSDNGGRGFICRLDAVPIEYFRKGSSYVSALDGGSDTAREIWDDAITNPIMITDKTQFIDVVFVGAETTTAGGSTPPPCTTGFIFPLFNPVVTGGQGLSDDFVTKQFFNISNLFSDDVADIVSVTAEAYNHTTTTTIYPEETIAIGANATGTFTANAFDEVVYYYKVIDICGLETRLVGNDAFTATNFNGEQISDTNSYSIVPALIGGFTTNNVQIGFKTIARGGTVAGVYDYLLVCSQSGIRSVQPAFEDFASYEYSVINNTTGESATSGTITGYDGICYTASLPSGYSNGDSITVTLSITGTLGSTNSRTETFTIS